MNVTIRQEKQKDHNIVENLVVAAFKDVAISDHKEQFLVRRLRKSEAFIPELSLVAALNGQIIGHILLTKIKIANKNKHHGSLALAPISVLPEFQGKGIGGKLILSAHRIAESLGFQSIILLGHANYYPRFGYKKASEFDIQLPFEVPEENCMAIELKENALNKVSGTVVYPKAFFE
ncbi:MAG: N-acetyltransferase [Bacteroidota bacterium]